MWKDQGSGCFVQREDTHDPGYIGIQTLGFNKVGRETLLTFRQQELWLHLEVLPFHPLAGHSILESLF
jgi:hypothetical protein